MTTNDTPATEPVPSAVPLPTLYKLRARGKWVLIRMLAKEERVSAGGIYLSQAQAKTQHGIIEDVDSSEVPDLFKGDIVVFTNFPNALDDIEELTGQRDLYLVRDEEIYASAFPIDDPEELARLHQAIAERHTRQLMDKTAIDQAYADQTSK